MPINVTKPFTPDFDRVVERLRGVWTRCWFTNNGPLVNELEMKLKSHLEVEHLLLLANGTLALQVAIKALQIKGEVITTPFSYIATTSSLVWEGCSPIMADIDPITLCISPESIRRCITPSTSAIVATHVYGVPCDVVEISKIAKEHNLKVLYDAAHGFGVKIGSEPIVNFGDVSTLSFHATKLFHTVEGGAVITKNPDLLKLMSELRNFGHTSPESFSEPGINAKNSEVHAAIGLEVLPNVPEIVMRRRIITERYNIAFKHEKRVRTIKIDSNVNYNYAYYPIILEHEDIVLQLIEKLNTNGIYPRRYFFPSLSEIRYINQSDRTPVSNDFARRVLCLPLHQDLSIEEADMISRICLRLVRHGG